MPLELDSPLVDVTDDEALMLVVDVVVVEVVVVGEPVVAEPVVPEDPDDPIAAVVVGVAVDVTAARSAVVLPR